MTLKRFGDLVPGDIIRGPNGEEVVVREAYDQHVPERMFEIELENGESIKASGNHLWYIETDFDHSYHRERRREGKQLLSKQLNEEMMNNLFEIAVSEDEIETSLMDMTNLLDAWDNRPVIYLLERILESIGHVSENKAQYQDLMTGETYVNPVNDVRHYDARRFAQQILSLTGKKKFVKKYPLIVGKVITTLDLLELPDADIPVMKPLSNSNNNN